MSTSPLRIESFSHTSRDASGSPSERWVLSAKSECLDHLILFREKTLRRTISEFESHYHQERPHQGVGNVLLFPKQTSAPSRSPVNLCLLNTSYGHQAALRSRAWGRLTERLSTASCWRSTSFSSANSRRDFRFESDVPTKESRRLIIAADK